MKKSMLTVFVAVLFILPLTTCKKQSSASPAPVGSGLQITSLIYKTEDNLSNHVTAAIYIETDGAPNTTAAVACNSKAAAYNTSKKEYETDGVVADFNAFSSGVTVTVNFDGDEYKAFVETFSGQTLNANYDSVSWNGSASISILTVYKILSETSSTLTYSGTNTGNVQAIPASAYPDPLSEYKVRLYLERVYTDHYTGGEVASGCSVTVKDCYEWRFRLPGTATGTTETAQNKIAFINYYGSNMDIFLMDPDGTNIARLTDEPTIKEHLAWSPDKSKLAFSAMRNNRRDIYTIGTDAANLTNLTAPVTYGIMPAWSPDGARIVYSSAGSQDMYIMNADGTGNTRITYTAADELWPCWANDGSKIFYNLYNGTSKICTIKPDGTDFTELTESYYYSLPKYSPDGSSMLCMGSFSGPAQIYKMDSDGNNIVQLTNEASGVADPSWSPDGTRIIYSTYYGVCPNCKSEIFVMNSDGSGKTKISSLLGDNFMCVWR